MKRTMTYRTRKAIVISLVVIVGRLEGTVIGTPSPSSLPMAVLLPRRLESRVRIT
jgi:hypothetical protein